MVDSRQGCSGPQGLARLAALGRPGEGIVRGQSCGLAQDSAKVVTCGLSNHGPAAEALGPQEPVPANL